MSLKENQNQIITTQIDFIIKSYDKLYLNQYTVFIKRKQNAIDWNQNTLKILSSSIVYLPRKRNLFTVLRSPHVNKTARDQFEIRIYKRLIRFKLQGTKNSIKKFLDLFQTNSNGVSLKITIYSYF